MNSSLIRRVYMLTLQTDEAKQAQRDANKRKQQGEDEEDTPGIMSLVSGVLSASAPVPVLEVDAEAESPEVPELVDTGLATLQDALDKADVIVQVVDARDIQGGRSAWVQNLVEESGGKYALLVNKIGESKRWLLDDSTDANLRPRSARKLELLGPTSPCANLPLLHQPTRLRPLFFHSTRQD